MGGKKKGGKGGGKGKKGPKVKKAPQPVTPEVVTAAQGMEMSLDDFNSKKKEIAKQTVGLKNAGIHKKKSGAKGAVQTKKKGPKATKGGRGDPGHAVGQAWEQGGQLFTPDGRAFSANDVASFGNYMVKNFGANSVPKSVKKQVDPAARPGGGGGGRSPGGGGGRKSHPAEGLLDKQPRGRQQSSQQRPKPALRGAIGKRRPGGKGRVTPKSSAGKKRGVIKASKVPGKQIGGLNARLNSAL